MLAIALNRAEQRHSRVLILNKSDRGLTSETIFRIMLNTVHWFRSKSILLPTLHNDQVQERLPFDHILHFEYGHIQSILMNVSENATATRLYIFKLEINLSDYLTCRHEKSLTISIHRAILILVPNICFFIIYVFRNSSSRVLRTEKKLISYLRLYETKNKQKFIHFH